MFFLFPSLLIFFVCLRISSVIFVQTWFVPDEYWQSLEVAHYLVFNVGSLTWEWFHGIRSVFYPTIISLLYSLLKVTGLSYSSTLITIPRIAQAVFTGWTESKFLRCTKKAFGDTVFYWIVFLESSSYFLYYIGSRTLANTFEMNLVLLGISYFAENKKGPFFLLVIISCYVRPTCVPIWIPFVIYILGVMRGSFMQNYLILFKSISVIGIFVLVDSMWYGKLTLVPLQFVWFNLLNNFANFYGEHPWHWFLTNALPSIYGPFFFLLLADLIKGLSFSSRAYLSSLIKLSCCLFITGHSITGHKEVRFLAPVVPLMNCILATYFAKSRWKKTLAVSFLALNIPLAFYLGLRHQRGVIDTANFLAQNIRENNTVVFLMPCHSTPLYSHIHINATLRFLTCPPNLNNLDNYQDEADVFYNSTRKWVCHYLPLIKPEMIVLFDVLLKELGDYLSSHDFKLVANFFHADFLQGRVGKRVLVFQKNSNVTFFCS